MLVYFTWPTKRLGGHQSQLTTGQSLCLLSCSYSDTQRTYKTVLWSVAEKMAIYVLFMSRCIQKKKCITSNHHENIGDSPHILTQVLLYALHSCLFLTKGQNIRSNARSPFVSISSNVHFKQKMIMWQMEVFHLLWFKHSFCAKHSFR